MYRCMMMTAADVSAVAKPWQYQYLIEHLIYSTYNDVMTENVSVSLTYLFVSSVGIRNIEPNPHDSQRSIIHRLLVDVICLAEICGAQ